MPAPTPRTRALGWWLIVAGSVGWFAAFSLLTDRFTLLADPGALLACDISPLVQCSANLSAWQGAVAGFPNPILGVTGWVAPVVVGIALIGHVRFPRWFWAGFLTGITLAMTFVVWLIVQSIFVLGTLCPWCMVTWAVTIPTFFWVWLAALRDGLIPTPAAIRTLATTLMGWLPLIVVASYLAIAVAAQMRLNVLRTVFGL